MVSLLAGYAAPPLAGISVGALLTAGKAPLVVGLGVVMALALWFAPPTVQVWLACALLGLLLTNSAVDMPCLTVKWWHTPPGEESPSNDAVALYR